MTFKFQVTYFKYPSGKLYVTDTFDLDVVNCGPPGHRSAYMYEVTDWLRAANREGKLPGLASGRWDGYIHVDCEEGYPWLIVPEGVK